MGDRMDTYFWIQLFIGLYIIIGMVNGAKCMSWSNGYINPKDVFLWPLNL